MGWCVSILDVRLPLNTNGIDSVFSALRAYVLSSRSWAVALLVFLLSVAPVVLNYVSL